MQPTMTTTTPTLATNASRWGRFLFTLGHKLHDDGPTLASNASRWAFFFLITPDPPSLQLRVGGLFILLYIIMYVVSICKIKIKYIKNSRKTGRNRRPTGVNRFTVSTGVGLQLNRLRPVFVGLVAVAPFWGPKTGPNRTYKHYLKLLLLTAVH
jgi:hypothetical protein